jgi:hypothetical protein
MLSHDGLEQQIAAYRRMTGQERFQIGLQLYDLARSIVRSGVRDQHPDWNDEQVEREVTRRFRFAADRLP